MPKAARMVHRPAGLCCGGVAVVAASPVVAEGTVGSAVLSLTGAGIGVVSAGCSVTVSVSPSPMAKYEKPGETAP